MIFATAANAAAATPNPRMAKTIATTRNPSAQRSISHPFAGGTFRTPLAPLNCRLASTLGVSFTHERYLPLPAIPSWRVAGPDAAAPRPGARRGKRKTARGPGGLRRPRYAGRGGHADRQRERGTGCHGGRVRGPSGIVARPFAGAANSGPT